MYYTRTIDSVSITLWQLASFCCDGWRVFVVAVGVRKQVPKILAGGLRLQMLASTEPEKFIQIENTFAVDFRRASIRRHRSRPRQATMHPRFREGTLFLMRIPMISCDTTFRLLVISFVDYKTRPAARRAAPLAARRRCCQASHQARQMRRSNPPPQELFRIEFSFLSLSVLFFTNLPP